MTMLHELVNANHSSRQCELQYKIPLNTKAEAGLTYKYCFVFFALGWRHKKKLHLMWNKSPAGKQIFFKTLVSNRGASSKDLFHIKNPIRKKTLKGN